MGSLFSKPKAPKAPNYKGLISEQARYNMVNTVSPFGSSTWTANYVQPTQGQYTASPVGAPAPVAGVGQRAPTAASAPASIAPNTSPFAASGISKILSDRSGKGNKFGGMLGAVMNNIAQNVPQGPMRPEVGAYTNTTQFSPEMQAVFDKALASAGNAGGQLKAPEYRQAPAPGRELGSYGDAQYKTLEDAMYQRAMAPLESQFAQDNRAFEQSMADRGLPVGAEAYNDKFSLMQDAQNRARADAALAAVLGSRGAFETDRAFNNGLNQQDFANQNLLDQQAQQWALQQSGMALNKDQVNYGQLASLLGGLQQPQQTPIDVLGAAGLSTNAAMNNYNQQMNAYNGAWGGLAGLGGALGAAYIMAPSDERLKDNITKIGEVGGLNFYKWEWKPEFKDIATGPTYGFIAQEVQQTHPQHVVMKNGYLAIDYTSLLEDLAQ